MGHVANMSLYDSYLQEQKKKPDLSGATAVGGLYQRYLETKKPVVPKPSLLDNAIGTIKDYAASSFSNIKDFFTNPKNPIQSNPFAPEVSAVKNTVKAAQQGFGTGVDAVSKMLEDYQNGTGSTAGDVANLANQWHVCSRTRSTRTQTNR